MRGWPSIELAALACALALVVLPLHAFTFGRRPAPPGGHSLPAHVHPDDGAFRVIHASLRFAHPPQRFEVSVADQTVWSGRPGGMTRVAGRFEASLPDGFLDLRLEVEWPENTPESAVELTLEPDEMETRSRTVWGTGRLDANPTYSWP